MFVFQEGEGYVLSRASQNESCGFLGTKSIEIKEQKEKQSQQYYYKVRPVITALLMRNDPHTSCHKPRERQ